VSHDNDDEVLLEVGVGPWEGPWPADARYDPDLLATGDRRNVVDRYRYWTRAAIVADLDEVTLVAPDAFFETLDEPLAIERGWHRITFAGPLPWEMVGFLADVAGRLAAARIPFTSMSGFTTDHVLVRAAQAELALAVLRGEPVPEQRPDVTNP